MDSEENTLRSDNKKKKSKDENRDVGLNIESDNKKKLQNRNGNKNLLSVVILFFFVILALVLYFFYAHKEYVSLEEIQDTKISKMLDEKIDLDKLYSNIQEENNKITEQLQKMNEQIIQISEQTKAEITKELTAIKMKEALYNDKLQEVQSYVQKINEKLDNINFNKLHLIRLTSILEEAKINFNYWGNKERTLILLNIVSNSLVDLNSIDVSSIKLLVSNLLMDVHEKKLNPFKEIIQKIDLLAREICKINFDKIKIKEANEKNKDIEKVTGKNWHEKLYASLDELKHFIKIRKKTTDQVLEKELNGIHTKEKVILILSEAKLAILANDNNMYHKKITKVRDFFKKVEDADSALLVLLKDLNQIDLANNLDKFVEIEIQINKLIKSM